jgi:hypothetical protein
MLGRASHRIVQRKIFLVRSLFVWSLTILPKGRI